MKSLFIAVMALFLIACSSTKHGGETLSGLVAADDFKPDVQQVVKVSARETIQSYRKLLDFSVDNPFRPPAMHRLADLLLDYGEQREARLMNQNISQEVNQYHEAILIYEELLGRYPEYPETDLVLYQLARAYDKQDDLDKASLLLSKLVKNYPESRYFSESHFRLGELNFLYGNYQQASASYSAVLEMGKDKPFYKQSLLKYSWSALKQDQLNDALQSFFSLLQLNLAQKEFDPISGYPVSIDKADHETLTDILHGMTLIFALKNSPQELVSLSHKYGHSSYNHLIYQSLAELYHKEERYLNEAEIYAAYIAEYSGSINAAIFQLKQVDSYRLLNDMQKMVKAKEKFVNDFWLPNVAGDGFSVDYLAYTSAFAKSYLNDLTDYYHSRFQKSKLAADFNAAINWYQVYLEIFYAEDNAIEKHFLLAELLYENDNYKQAGDEYTQVAYHYPKHERAADAAYSAILSYQELLTSGASTADNWRQLQRQSALSFIANFPADKRVPNTVLSIASNDFERGDHGNAMLLVKLLLDGEQQLVDEDAFAAWMMVGHINFNNQDYLQAEQAFQSARKYLGENTKQSLDSEKWLAASIYKQAEVLQALGERYSAVNHLLRIEKVAPGSVIVAQAKYDAAAELIALEDWQQAANLLKTFQTVYPRHELQPEVPAKLAYIYMKLDRRNEAAQAYEQIAIYSQDIDVQKEALLQSAQLYRQENNFIKAADVYKRYIYKFPDVSEQVFYARSQLAEIYAKLGQIKKHDYWLEDIIKTAKLAAAQQNEAIQYYAAKASLILAESKLIEFDSIKLVRPLRQNLVKKKAAMETAIEAYRKTTSYGYAEFVSAANHRIGEIYFKLSIALLESDRPTGLDEEEMELYEIMLEEQVYPLEEQAINFFEANVVFVENDVYNEWIEQSYASLSSLLPVQYAKEEILTEVIDVLH